LHPVLARGNAEGSRSYHGSDARAASKVLDSLEGRRWIARVTKPDDNRVRLLSLRPKGRGGLPDLAAIVHRSDQQFFGCLSPNERATLRRLLQKLTDIHRFNGVPID
jgi:DNA-binding MarR family transcriptional regulator